MMFWTDHDLTGGGWAVMIISMVLFWGLLIGLGVWLVRALSGSGPNAEGRLSPEQVLAERFARGEIDEDEYQRRLAALASFSHGAPPP